MISSRAQRRAAQLRSNYQKRRQRRAIRDRVLFPPPAPIWPELPALASRRRNASGQRLCRHCGTIAAPGVTPGTFGGRCPACHGHIGSGAGYKWPINIVAFGDDLSTAFHPLEVDPRITRKAFVGSLDREGGRLPYPKWEADNYRDDYIRALEDHFQELDADLWSSVDAPKSER